MPAVAVPAVVAQSNVTALPLAADRVTVKVAVVVPALPSVTVTSLTDRVGAASSSVIVPRPEPSAIVAFPGLERVMPKVSSISSSTSPFTVTVNVVVVEPAETVLLPLAATKSVPAVAEPAAVAQSNVTAWPLAADSVTVNVAVVVPAFPFGDGDVVDREGGSGVVVGDRPEARAVCDRGVPRVGKRDAVRLVRLVHGVAVHGDA